MVNTKSVGVINCQLIPQLIVILGLFIRKPVPEHFAKPAELASDLRYF